MSLRNIFRTWSSLMQGPSIRMTTVEVEQGKLKGARIGDSEADYVAFKGIPYARPPLGILRFKAPEPPQDWEGVRDATAHGPVCPQYNDRLQRLEAGSEDCLYLNVYSKTLTPPQPLPVMVWIHGGAFYTGSGNSDFYGPEFFMKHDVILVTFNYRLEVLGFLCVGNEDVPGNAGLKDQVAALKWVKRNISVFGGDPNNVTIFGCSAGAASVSYHLLSKMSGGLFNKAICQSGVCLNEWSYNIYARERAFQLGKLLGLETEDPQALSTFLKNAPVSDLVNIKLPPIETKHKDLTDSILFGPVVENAETDVEHFITKPPPELVRSGCFAKVPIILGFTSGEGMELGKHFPANLNLLLNTGAVVPRELKLTLTEQQLRHADIEIRKYYFKEKPLTADMLQEVVNLETDRLFVYNIIRFARYHSYFTSSPVYMYKFTAETERNYVKKFYKMDSISGCCHADDLYYLFNVTCQDVPLTSNSQQIIDNFVQMWCNFAANGNPSNANAVWKPFTDSQRNFLIIDREVTCVANVDDENIKFWENLYNEADLEAR
ncbi:esterase B1-like isoform X2 [Danaus plexippus]|uniref:esterase B1-like isoform X2 n=1 Tax=Danaus plexippus TaxID=13037 RepID=UPI002AB1B0C8|nr:esterase B1-like isoform X2 [Danaus plexippus]